MKAGKGGQEEGRLHLEVEHVELSSAAFVACYRKAQISQEKRLGRLVEHPGEEEVHDARTAMRRMEAYVSLLPGKMRRSEEAKNLSKRQRKFFERTAELRDTDVIREKVLAREGEATLLLQEIDRRRARLAKKAGAAAEAVRGASAPVVTADDVSKVWLERRFRKVERRLREEVNQLLGLVSRDPADLRDLHRLRIACKKLRYLLEAVRAGRPEVVRRLERWQDSLGSIHDLDIAVAYLREEGWPARSGLAKTWTEMRNQELDGFLRSLERASRGRLPRRHMDLRDRFPIERG